MAKNQAKAKQQPETKPLLCFLHPCYHPNIIGDTLKNVVKKKEFIWLMTMKMRLKMKNRSHDMT